MCRSAAPTRACSRAGLAALSGHEVRKVRALNCVVFQLTARWLPWFCANASWRADQLSPLPWCLDRWRGRGPDVELVQAVPVIEPPQRGRSPLVYLARQAHEGGHQRGPNHKRINKDRDGQADAEQLDERDLRGAESEEDDADEHPRRR
jgi:hypothetical protein